MSVFFKAPELCYSKIRQKVEEFRGKYLSCQSVPVDVEELLEMDLALDIVPIDKLYQDCDIEALLMSDKKTIIIDKGIYMHNSSNKMRFALAHEIGHLILHEYLWSIFEFYSVFEWIKFYRTVDIQQYARLEAHASEFAGRLLVPYNRLLQEVKLALEKVPPETSKNIEELLSYLAPSICRIFEVSDQVIDIRISRENLIKEF